MAGNGQREWPELWTRALLGILTAAGTAWGAALVNRIGDLEAELEAFKLSGYERITKLEAAQAYVERALLDHRNEPAHGDVVKLLERLKGRVDSLERRAQR